MKPTLTDYTPCLTRAKTLLERLPLHKLDRDTTLLHQAFTLAFQAGVFDLHRYDSALHNDLKLELFSTLCPLSGSLAFLGVQILAANRIMQSHHFPLAETYYQQPCGIAINHLRAPRTVVDSIKQGDNYALTGVLTWASGYGIFDGLVIGFHHEGQEMQGVIPFVEQSGFSISPPDDTFVGFGMHTVTIHLDDYIITPEQIINTQPIGTYTHQKSVSKTVHFALYGIGLGALQQLQDIDVKAKAFSRLEARKTVFLQTQDPDIMDQQRIQLFQLVQQIVTTGMVLYGGGSILITQTLQRYYRELIMFNANGLNDTLKGYFKASFLKE